MNNRQFFQRLASGLQIYKVKLVGGAYNKYEALCSHDTVIMGGEVYQRGPDDRYYFQPDDKSDARN